MNYYYIPRGVCSSRFDMEINNDGIIENLSVRGGCSGNNKGISALAKGRHIDEIIELFEGVTCGRKTTSCPDQMAKMLTEIRDQRRK